MKSINVYSESQWRALQIMNKLPQTKKNVLGKQITLAPKGPDSFVSTYKSFET